MEWIDWMTVNPVEAGSLAGGAAVALLVLIVLARLAFAAIGRRLMVGLGLRKKVERENPWATIEDRAAYKLRPEPRPWWAFWRRA